MLRALECPNCGAPLEVEGDAAVVECHYCARHIVVSERKVTKAPAQAKTRDPASAPADAPALEARTKRRAAQDDARRRKLGRYLSVGLTVAAGVAAALFLFRKGKRDEGPDVGLEQLRQLDLAAGPNEVEALFGAAVNRASTPTQTTLDFKFGEGMVRRALLSRSLPDKSHLSGVELQLNGGLDVAGTVAKLQQVVPHRLEKQNEQNYRLYVGDAVLDVSTVTVKTWHWSSIHGDSPDYANCEARLAAFWALARWATIDGPALTPEQVKLVRGPALADATALDPNVTVEKAVDAFKAAVPSGWCRMQAGLMCVADVDDAHVREVRWQWPNGLRAQAQSLRFELAKGTDAAGERALAGCLEPTLGKPEEVVVDYVRGVRAFTWKLGDGGGTAVIQNGFLMLASGDQQAVDQPAPWAARLKDVAGAVERCKP